jgi:uncharacterized protein YgiM (DUF1202 family)
MIRLTLFLSGLIWAFMAFAPELDEPVFTEVAAVAQPDVVTEPIVSRGAISPVALVAPTPEPAVEVAAVTPQPVGPVTITPEPEHIVWFVTGSRVNVRSGPSTDYAVLGKVVYGEAFELVSDPNAEWIKIRIEGDGVEGYIVKRLTTEQDPLR